MSFPPTRIVNSNPSSMLTTFGIRRIRISLYYPQADGMMVRFHRTLEAALTAHDSPQWSRRLSTVLLAYSIKPDFGASPAELVYGTTLRLPGELFHSTPVEQFSHDLVNALSNSMSQLRPTQGTNHDKARRVSVPSSLETSSHVFVRIDAHRTPLQPRREGPYAVPERFQAAIQR